MFGLRDVVDDAGLTIEGGGGNSTFHSALMSRFISSRHEKTGAGSAITMGRRGRAGGRVVIIILLLLLHLVLLALTLRRRTMDSLRNAAPKVAKWLLRRERGRRSSWRRQEFVHNSDPKRQMTLGG